MTAVRNAANLQSTLCERHEQFNIIIESLVYGCDTYILHNGQWLTVLNSRWLVRGWFMMPFTIHALYLCSSLWKLHIHFSPTRATENQTLSLYACSIPVINLTFHSLAGLVAWRPSCRCSTVTCTAVYRWKQRHGTMDAACTT